MRGRIKAAVLLSMALIFVQRVDAMSLFGIGETCVFSEVRVRLLLDGNPVINKKVIRQWEWNKRRSDQSITDEQGYASFPAVYEASVSRLLPTELVIGQQLSVELDGGEKVFWTNSKREPEENAEYGGAASNLICDLSDEERLIEDYGSLMVTMCRLVKE